MQQDPIVIIGAARTPMGAFQGNFSGLAAHDLGAWRSVRPWSARASRRRASAKYCSAIA